MRRLTRDTHSEDRGAITVLVAILMVVLLGSVAIAVDVGAIYSERAQLQSGADAAAIATAQKCARDAGSESCSTTSTLAGSLANQNALDGMSKRALHRLGQDREDRGCHRRQPRKPAA